MIPSLEAVRAISREREDAIVVSTMSPNRYWEAVTETPDLDLPIFGAMGKASSVALGLSLARPDKKVIIVDGDGSLPMNLGSLVTIAGKAPENLLHFVLDNGVYAVTGGQPTPNANGFSFAGLAKASGYASAFEFDDLEEFATGLDAVMSAPGPVMVCIKTDPAIINTPSWPYPLGTIRFEPVAMKEVARALNQ